MRFQIPQILFGEFEYQRNCLRSACNELFSPTNLIPYGLLLPRCLGLRTEASRYGFRQFLRVFLSKSLLEHPRENSAIYEVRCDVYGILCILKHEADTSRPSRSPDSSPIGRAAVCSARVFRHLFAKSLGGNRGLDSQF